ncbi:MAG: diacylglycerol O-acyltransferase / wax synthase [Acidimicrobiaceae bacterium]|nr:diacylglycerol O-acyltransferase / wax synthase [Acidimicrobiaceae bacterium]
MTDPLPAEHPLWSASLVTALADEGCALIIVFHHVLADGMGGLAVLANLVDGGAAHRSGTSRGPSHPGKGFS